MAGVYIFNISIFSQNRFQVSLDDYLYSYRSYDPATEEEWMKDFGSGIFPEKIEFELEDYYSGYFFEKIGNYPDARGPGGGGYSASSYIKDVATGSITPTAETNYSTSDVLSVRMSFDKDKVLTNNGEGVKKIESDLRYVIETAFKNSTVNPKKQEVYIDPEFTRDTGYPASPNPTSSQSRIVWKIEGQIAEEDEEGKPKRTYANPAYTPNGKTYSVPQTPDYKLYKSFQSETSDDYYLYYYINELVPTPPKNPATQSGSQSEAPVTGTASEESSSKGEYVFNVEKSKIFKNSQFGDLTIIEKVEPGEEVPGGLGEGEDIFIFEDQGDDVLDSEYVEGGFIGDEESFELVIGEEFNSNSVTAVDQTEGEIKEDFNSSPGNDNTTVESGAGATNNLKPTKKGYLMGSSFTKTQQYKEKWNVKVDETYRLTGFKFGKPKITEETFIKRVKKAEGGIANGTSDSAYRTYGDKTVLPISKKDHPNAKKYDKLCTNSSGKRLYNIHTNKGILWLVFKTQFGDSVSVQERYLKMSDDDWWTIMKERFVTANKGEKIKSKIASYFWVYWCWGSGAGGAIKLLNTCLNLLSGSKKYSSGKITDAHINYMNDLYSSGKEDQLISAMYDVRIQNLLNISQPGNKNSVYRNGWVNGINAWITDFHET